MSRFGDALRRLRLNRGLSQEELARLLGTTKQVISNYEIGKRVPKVTTAKEYADVLHVPLSYFEDPDGMAKSNIIPMPAKPTLPAADQSLLDKYHILDTHGKAVVDTVLTAEYSRCVALEYETTPVRRYANPSAAGEPLWAEGEYEMVDYEKRLVPKGTDYAVGISGHSMEPTLMDGSTVFVRKTHDIVDGDVIIAWIEGEGTVCKRVLIENGKLVRLTSDNPEYGGIEGERLNNMRVYGKVIGYTVKVK